MFGVLGSPASALAREFRVMDIFKKKLQDLKKTIRAWIRDTNKSYVGVKKSISDELVAIDKILDTGAVSDELLANRLDLSHKLHELNQLDLKEAAQKAKVKWSIEGNDNSKKIHAVLCFFDHGFFPRGCNSSLIALIPKVTDTKFVIDFRPISLIGSVYKVVTKILVNRLAMVISDLVSNTQSAFVAGDPLAPLLFILIMESLHISVSRAANNGVFKGLQIQASGLKINVNKSQVLGVGVPPDIVNQGASHIGCLVMHLPFKYLGVMVGDHMSRYSAWSSSIQKIRTRLSKWKVKTLSVCEVSVAAKFGDPSLDDSFRRQVRDGSQRQQWLDLVSMLDEVSLSSSSDRWYCDFNGDGAFRVKEIRSNLDDIFLPSSNVFTRWVRYVPIKINIFTWCARLDRLPTIGNLINRGVSLDSPLCPICGLMLEDSQHLFFRCDMAKCIFQRICRWWNLQWVDAQSFDDWLSWFKSVRMPRKPKDFLEGVFYTSWWHIWNFRNRLIFDASPPRRSIIFDDIVSSSFNWCVNRESTDEQELSVLYLTKELERQLLLYEEALRETLEKEARHEKEWEERMRQE
nr:RNA-directed DNA polymerase, eukaryota [Tanacetum cinerariifolium]